MKTIAKQQKSLQIVLHSIGNKLLELRINKGYSSHADFARDHGLPTIQYWRIEKGKANITLKSLHKVLWIHGVSIDDFFADMKKK